MFLKPHPTAYVVHTESFNDATKSCQVSIFFDVGLQFIKKTETNVSNVKKWIALFRKGNILLYYKIFQTNAVILFIGSVAHGPGKCR